MAEDRLRTLQDVLLRVAAGDYTAQVPITGVGDEVEAICLGVNLLAQELAHERSIRSEAEAALARARVEQRAQEVRKMRALAELSGGVAHDLNNLLSVMSVVSAAIREGGVADQDALLNDLEEAVARGVTLARHLLSVSVDTAHALPVDPSQALSNAVRLARRVAPSGVRVDSRVPPSLPRVIADTTELERVLLNLTTNGLQAMPDGGCLEILASHEGNDVWVRVRDTGVGMNAAVLARATEPLFTTKPDGTGFGLALAYALCERAGGELEIESAPGQGTLVALRLPAAREAS